MKAVKWVLCMCVALFVLYAAFGSAVSAPARCSSARPENRRAAPAGDARLVQPALPGLRFITIGPLY